MTETRCMSGIQSCRRLRQKIPHGREWIERARTNEIPKTPALAKGKDEKGTTVRVGLEAIVKDGKDVWMVQGALREKLAFERDHARPFGTFHLGEELDAKPTVLWFR